MKAVLFLCLLSLFAGKLDILSTGVCLITNPKVIELGSKVLGYIKTKDFDSILPTLISKVPEMAAVVKDCLKYKNENKLIVDNDNADDEVTLKEKFLCRHYPDYVKCLNDIGTTFDYCKRKHC